MESTGPCSTCADPVQHDAYPRHGDAVFARGAQHPPRHGLGGKRCGEKCEERERELQGLNFPKPALSLKHLAAELCPKCAHPYPTEYRHRS